jgi:single-strand DNA-binding protein
MSASNNFNLSGRLAADPELQTGASIPWMRIRLAVDGYDRKEKEKRTDFFTVTLFGAKAEVVGKYCHKGSYLTVQGELKDNQYVDKEGNKRYEVQMLADDVALGPKVERSEPREVANADPYGFGA